MGFNEEGCTCCVECDYKRFCENGNIRVEAIEMCLVKIEPPQATVTVRVGPTELFECHVREEEDMDAWFEPEDPGSLLPLYIRLNILMVSVAAWQNYWSANRVDNGGNK